MTPEAEVKRLLDKYLKVLKDRTDVFNAYSDLSFAKECALICAERNEELAYTIPISDATFSYRKEQLKYWEEVKSILSTQTT
jgi:hypothetical protein